MKKYELWLDETGDFSAKEQVSGSRGDKVYSFIGGVLTPMDCISVEEAARMVGNETGHATELAVEEIRNDLVPSLKALYEKGARFVFFENRKRYTKENHVDLYMEMMIDGIMQLLSFLAVFDREFQLDIMIADRYTKVEEGVLEKIPYQDYNENLKKMLFDRIRYGFMGLDEDIKVNIVYGSARKEPKLKLADYACGARRAVLRANDTRYTEENKGMLRQLFDENYIFDSYEYSIMGQVKRKLGEHCLAEAMLILCNDKKLFKELPEEYTAQYGRRLKDKIKWLIFAKMRELGKLEIRGQLEELLVDVRAAIQLEDEYEWSEVLLHTLEEEFMEELKKYEIYDDRLDLAMAFAYAELYRKEGDLKNLQKAIDRAERSHRRLPQSLDFLWNPFQIWILKQACCLENGDYEGAKQWEAQIRERTESLEELLILAEMWKEGQTVPNRFQKETLRLKEMRIYLQNLHGQMDRQTVEEEMEQSINRIDAEDMNEIRIFPKGCFYYLVDTGRSQKAFSWLLEFAGLEPIKENENNPTKLREKADAFCQVLLQMDGRQKMELIREYLYLMKKLKEQEMQGKVQVMCSNLLAKSLEDSALLEYLTKGGKDIMEMKSVYPVKQNAQYRHLVRSVLKDYQDKRYHPLEQIWWLYASYLELSGKDADIFNPYYMKAIQICEESGEYLLLQKNLLGIKAERTGRRALRGHKKRRMEFTKVKEFYESLLAADVMTEGMADYLEREWKTVLSMIDNNMDGDVIGEMLLELACKMSI